jgi:hypothetical protein
MDAVCLARLDEIRTVVEDEERAVLIARGAKSRGCSNESLVVELLLTQLDDVDAAAQGCVQERTRILAVRPRVEHEIEAGARQALTAVRPVHRARLFARSLIGRSD